MSSARPKLPFDCANPLLKGRQFGPVKYQILNSSGIEIGRLKVDTPTGNGHAFILRRFDTDAISLSTMFRAAFPSASPSQEAAELQWAKESFDFYGNNGSKYLTSIPRLAGVWISPEDAATFAADYRIRDIVQVIIDAVPEPLSTYRRSKSKTDSSSPGKPQASQLPPSNSMVIPSSLPPLSTTKADPLPTPTPAKRRKEASPVPLPNLKPTSPPQKAPRRSMRATKSPTPARTLPPRVTRKTPTRQANSSTAVPEEMNTPSGSDETAVEEENNAVAETTTGAELHQQDVAEQKEMISRLKAEMAGDVAMSSGSEKRVREEDTTVLKMNIKEPETDSRTIASNSRIRRLGVTLEPKQKSFAWGVAAFAFGFGAMTYLPNIF